MMWRIKRRLRDLTRHIPIRWRLTLISLGLFTVLLSGLGVIILVVTEQALLNNQVESLRNEGFLAVKGLKSHPFSVGRSSGPPVASFPSDLHGAATRLVELLTSSTTDAVILSPQGTVIIPSNNFPLAPPAVKLSPTVVQQTLDDDSSHGSLQVRDSSKQRQLVVLIPLVVHQANTSATVAILQLSSPTKTTDDNITTLRFILLLGVAGALGVAVALTFPLIGTALRPLVDMERTSRYIAEEGALSMRLTTPATDDEIGRLTRSFNHMVEQLDTAFKRQKQFVADASHELRTPLTVLRGSLEMLLIGIERGDTATTRRLTGSMSSEVLRMQRLVENLLALTRLDEGRMMVKEDAVDVRSIIDKVYDQAHQLAVGQEIYSKVAPDLLLALADADRLQQVVLNIVENSVKYTPFDGYIELAAYNNEPDAVVIEIRDNGKGIPPGALPHVFDRFYRVDPARSRLSRSVGGNGLGLAIAKELIEAQGGTIAITSALSKGTTVTIRLRAVTNMSLIT